MTPPVTETQRFPFAFAPAYRLAGLPFGITPSTAWVEVGGGELRVRYGLWSMRTPLVNVESTEITGDFAFLKTAGPPHLSFSDRGVSFATNGDVAVCVQFRRFVKAIDPTGVIKHPGATMTVADPEGLRRVLEDVVEPS